jgi:hypothetical protein
VALLRVKRAIGEAGNSRLILRVFDLRERLVGYQVLSASENGHAPFISYLGLARFAMLARRLNVVVGRLPRSSGHDDQVAVWTY